MRRTRRAQTADSVVVAALLLPLLLLASFQLSTVASSASSSSSNNSDKNTTSISDYAADSAYQRSRGHEGPVAADRRVSPPSSSLSSSLSRSPSSSRSVLSTPSSPPLGRRKGGAGGYRCVHDAAVVPLVESMLDQRAGALITDRAFQLRHIEHLEKMMDNRAGGASNITVVSGFTPQSLSQSTVHPTPTREKTDRRRLQQDPNNPAPLRITPIYQLDSSSTTITASARAHIQNTIMPAAITFFKRAFKAINPIEDLFYLPWTCSSFIISNNVQYCLEYSNSLGPGGLCGTATLDDAHFPERVTYAISGGSIVVSETRPAGEGLADTDIVIYITAKNSGICASSVGASSQVLAYAGLCILDSDLDRPVAGFVNYCPGSLEADLQSSSSSEGEEESSVDDEVVQAHLRLTVHEMFHVLAFSSSLFKYFRTQDGQPRVTRYDPSANVCNGETESACISKAGRPIETAAELASVGNWQSIQDFQLETETFLPVSLNTPAVLSSGRAHFGCDSLTEIPLETAGGAGSAGSHWEARILERDVMTPVIVDEMVFSELDGAVANDSGWYIVDQETIGGLLYGRDTGCSFVQSTDYCSFSQPNPLENVWVQRPVESIDSSFQNLFCTVDELSSDPLFVYETFADDLPNAIEEFIDGINDTPRSERTKEYRCIGDTAAVGKCQSPENDLLFDGCEHPKALSAIGNCRVDVDESEASVIFAANWGWTWGLDSDCFKSSVWAKRIDDTYSWTNAPGAACHRRRCLVDEDGGYLLQIDVGGFWHYCPSGSEMLPVDAGFVSGYIQCPADVQDYCSTIEKCQDRCSGNGNCLQGVCYCFPGYGGEFCQGLLECAIDEDCREDAFCDASDGKCYFTGNNSAVVPTQEPLSFPSAPPDAALLGGGNDNDDKSDSQDGVGDEEIANDPEGWAQERWYLILGIVVAGVVIFIGVVSCRRSAMRSAGVGQQASPAAVAAAAAAAAAGGHPLGNQRRLDIVPAYVPPKNDEHGMGSSFQSMPSIYARYPAPTNNGMGSFPQYGPDVTLTSVDPMSAFRPSAPPLGKR